MPLALQLTEAAGTLHPAVGDKWGGDDDPVLNGPVYFDITGRWHAPVLRLQAAAWLDMRGGKLRYRLSVGGIKGSMSFRMRIAGAGPDYVGAIGPNSELQVAAWRNKVQAQENPSLTMVIYSSALGSQHLERLLARSLGTRT